MTKKSKLPEEKIKDKLKKYIKNKFLFRDKSKNIDDNDSFLEKGIIDSTGVLELVDFIEENFKINIEDEELIPENLDSINKIIAYIKKKRKYVSK